VETVEITETDLERLRLDMAVPRSPQNEVVATVVLARAGRATPPGRYILLYGRWMATGPPEGAG
jgi:hypothetical protein